MAAILDASAFRSAAECFDPHFMPQSQGSCSGCPRLMSGPDFDFMKEKFGWLRASLGRYHRNGYSNMVMKAMCGFTMWPNKSARANAGRYVSRQRGHAGPPTTPSFCVPQKTILDAKILISHQGSARTKRDWRLGRVALRRADPPGVEAMYERKNSGTSVRPAL